MASSASLHPHDFGLEAPAVSCSMFLLIRWPLNWLHGTLTPTGTRSLALWLLARPLSLGHCPGVIFASFRNPETSGCTNAIRSLSLQGPDSGPHYPTESLSGGSARTRVLSPPQWETSIPAVIQVGQGPPAGLGGVLGASCLLSVTCEIG